MTEINRRYFEGLMADKRLSLRGLAAKMDMNHSQLSLTFSGARRAQLDEAAKLSQIFGEPLHKVVEALGVTVRATAGKRVTVIGAVNGDGVVVPYPAGTHERTGAPGDLPDDAIAVQFRTASTPLDWADGFVMFCRERSSLDPAMLGRLCLAKIKDGPCVVAMVRRGYQDGTYNLSGPHAADSVALEWASPILLTRN